MQTGSRNPFEIKYDQSKNDRFNKQPGESVLGNCNNDVPLIEKSSSKERRVNNNTTTTRSYRVVRDPSKDNNRSRDATQNQQSQQNCHSNSVNQIGINQTADNRKNEDIPIGQLRSRRTDDAKNIGCDSVLGVRNKRDCPSDYEVRSRMATTTASSYRDDDDQLVNGRDDKIRPSGRRGKTVETLEQKGALEGQRSFAEVSREREAVEVFGSGGRRSSPVVKEPSISRDDQNRNLGHDQSVPYQNIPSEVSVPYFETDPPMDTPSERLFLFVFYLESIEISEPSLDGVEFPFKLNWTIGESLRAANPTF